MRWIASAIDAGLDLPADPSARRQAIIDAYVEDGVAPDVYVAQWDAYASWLFEALKRMGVGEGAALLDIGCGAGRGGAAALPLLGPQGRYAGVDAVARYVRMTERLLANARCDVRALVSETFEFERLGTTFDFAVAHSLFPHIATDQVEACFQALRPVMRPGGRFLFTFVSQENVDSYGHLYNGIELMTRSRGVTTDFMAELTERYGLRITRNLVSHPRQSAWVAEF